MTGKKINVLSFAAALLATEIDHTNDIRKDVAPQKSILSPAEQERRKKRNKKARKARKKNRK